MNTVPLLIEFVRGTSLYREPAIIPKLRIIHNGPPGTFVVFADGARVPLPTDQIVLAEDSSGGARVGFGGMSFGGMDDGRLIFHRVRDLQPAELLSPERGRKMTLAPHMIASISVDGRQVWPSGSSSRPLSFFGEGQRSNVTKSASGTFTGRAGWSAQANLRSGLASG